MQTVDVDEQVQNDEYPQFSAAGENKTAPNPCQYFKNVIIAVDGSKAINILCIKIALNWNSTLFLRFSRTRPPPCIYQSYSRRAIDGSAMRLT